MKSYRIYCVDREICSDCGDSVMRGSGKFVNRIPDANDYISRVSMHKPHPEGAYICEECDEKTSDD